MIITLNVNRKKNASMKRHRLAELMEKQNPYIWVVYKRPTSYLQTLKSLKEDGRMYFMKNGNNKKAGVAILISDKIDFKIKTFIRDKEYYVMIKGSTQEEDITIINMYPKEKYLST